MLTYALRRLLLAIPTLLFISLVIFLLLELSPGDPLGDVPLTVPPEVKERMREALGLGQAWYIRYVLWLKQFFWIEPMHWIDQAFGTSIVEGQQRIISFQSRVPVFDVIAERNAAPATVLDVGSGPGVFTAALAAHGQEMTASAITDALTGTLNRRGFEAEARRWLRAEAPGSLSLIAVDFDHFKQINDHWGHQAGDQALRHFAALVSSHVRAGDRVGRLGGDEFMILLPHSDLDLARGVGERVRAAVENAPLALGGQPVASLSLSMGIAAARSGESYEDLARRADRALYEAKEAGRNTIRWAG